MESFRRLSLAWFQFGTESYPLHTRRKLVITNVLVTIMAVSSLVFAAAFLIIDPVGLRWPIVVMVVLGPMSLLVPFWHPINPYAGSVFNLAVWYTYSLFMAYLLGSGSGFYFLFLVGITSAILIFGNRQNLISIINITLQFLFFLYAAKTWTEPAPTVTISDNFLSILFIFMTAFAVIVIFCLIYYAFWQVHRAEEALEREYQYSERLLANMMPRAIASQLKREPDAIIADAYDEATIMFADVVGFTERVAVLEPEEVVELLNELFTRFDALASKHGVEKIKTLGDAFMVAGGLPKEQEDHAERVIEMALDIVEVTATISEQFDQPVEIRIGIHTGPVIAGVIGTKKPFYDVWGDTVNLAARLESSGKSSKIQISDATKSRVEDLYSFEDRGQISLKGKGNTSVWFVTDRKSPKGAIFR